MKLEFAFLADAVKVQDNGVFDILGGGFDVLKGATTFPAVKPTVYLLGRVSLTKEESKLRHELVVEIIGPNKQPVSPRIRVWFGAFVDCPSWGCWATVSLHYQDLSFPEPGEYQFRFSVGGNHLGQIRLEVIA